MPWMITGAPTLTPFAQLLHHAKADAHLQTRTHLHTHAHTDIMANGTQMCTHQWIAFELWQPQFKFCSSLTHTLREQRPKSSRRISSLRAALACIRFSLLQ